MTTPNEELIALQRDTALAERDTLRAEVEAVRKANLDCVDHYNDAMTEIDTLRAQLAELTDEHNRVRDKWQDDYKLLDEVCRKATAQEKQLADIAATEPVGVIDEGDDGLFADLETPTGVRVKRGDKLFTRPMPAGVAELVEALEKLARLGNGEHYGNSDGNMIARDALAKYKGAK